MRRKTGWLALLWLLMAASLVANAAGMPQMTDIGVFSRANYGAVITLHVNGTFTHVDYRPGDELYIIDLPGIEIGAVEQTEQIFNLQGLKSFKVGAYAGQGGVPTVRVQVSLEGRPTVRVTEIRDGLMVHVSPDPATLPGAVPATPAVAETQRTQPRSESRVAPAPAPPATANWSATWTR